MQKKNHISDVIDGYFKQFDDYQDNHLLIFDVPNESDDEIFLRAELKILTLIDDDNSNFFKGNFLIFSKLQRFVPIVPSS